jgi:4-amino-4-deoxy-L-arabinose transferase-like glycosyltransferase
VASSTSKAPRRRAPREPERPSALSRTRFALALALLLVLAALLLLPSAGSAPLERAEIYFVDAARTMVETGSWLVPRYRGEPFFDKPALGYWLIAGSFEAFGTTLAAARLVPALAALLVIAASVALGRLLLGPRAALLGGLALATTPAFVSFGRVAMSDMPLTLFSTVSIALAVALFGPTPRGWQLPALGAALGLGFLTKGPVALLLPGLGILLLLWQNRARPLPVKTGPLLAAIALFALLGLSWFALLLARLGPAPLRYFFLHENVERFAGETYDAGRAPWYYLVTYLGEGLPWSLLFPAALFGALRGGEGRRGSRWLAAWAGLMAVPLSLSRGKLDYYLLPLYPALCLVVGDFLARPFSGPSRRYVQLALASTACLVALAPLALARVEPEWLPAPAIVQGTGLLAVAGALLLALAALRVSPGRTAATLGGVTAALFLLLGAVFLPAFRAAQPNAAIVADVTREQRAEPRVRLAFCEDPLRVERDVLFQLRLPSLERCDLWNPAASRFPFLVLLPRAQLGDLLAIPSLRGVAEYRYLPATALTLRGLLRGEPDGRLVLLANYPNDEPSALRHARRFRKRRLRREAQEQRRLEAQRAAPEARRQPVP